MTRQQQLIRSLLAFIACKPEACKQFHAFCLASHVVPMTPDELIRLQDQYTIASSAEFKEADPTRLLLQAMDTFIEHCDTESMDYIHARFLRATLAVYNNSGVISAGD